VYLQQQVAGGAAVETRAALARQADQLAFLDALGNLHLQRALLGHDLAAGVQPRAAQAELALGAAVGVDQLQLDARVLVLAAHGRVRAALGTRARPAMRAAEHLLEELAELGLVAAEARAGAGRPAVGVLVACVPARRWPHVVARARALRPGLRAHRVVGGALFGVAQHGVGLVDLGHALFGVRRLAHVRVVLARQLAVGLLDRVGAGRLGHAQDVVVVLEFHRPKAFPAACLKFRAWGGAPPLQAGS
jgi:hypothetical protein